MQADTRKAVRVHCYDEDGFYTGDDTAQPDQKSPGAYLMPPRSTFAPLPPGTPEFRRIPKYDEATKKWSAVPDFRGVPVFLKSTGERIYLQAGESMDDTMTLAPPPPGTEWVGGAWTEKIETTRNRLLVLLAEKRVLLQQFSYGPLYFWGDRDGAGLLSEAITRFGRSGDLPLYWWTVLDTPAPIDPSVGGGGIEQIRAMYTEAARTFENAFGVYKHFKAQIEAAATREELAEAEAVISAIQALPGMYGYDAAVEEGAASSAASGAASSAAGDGAGIGEEAGEQ